MYINSLLKIVGLVLLVVAICPAAMAEELLWGKVVDQDGNGQAHALIISGEQFVISGDGGDFVLETSADTVIVKKPGYLAHSSFVSDAEEIVLKRFEPKALYLSFYGAGHKGLRGSALDLISRTELNAVVIDVKGDRGLLSYPSSILLAHDIGAQELVTIPNLKVFVSELKEQGIYTIARVVVFKDDLLAKACPELAVVDQAGYVWTDREKLAWVDPHHPEVVEYNLKIAEEAAQLGFDEVQFDYIRFPDAARLVYARNHTFENRTTAINSFLKQAKEKLDRYGVYVSADVFGYICWNENDTYIGQHLETMLPHVDYLAPMLYPSGFSHGLPGFPAPLEAPYEMIYLSLEKAYQRTGADPQRFRPWLQAFRDYAFDRRAFREEEIGAQIKAADDFGSNGYMLWNASNRYSEAGVPACKATEVVDHLDEDRGSQQLLPSES